MAENDKHSINTKYSYLNIGKAQTWNEFDFESVYYLVLWARKHPCRTRVPTISKN